MAMAQRHLTRLALTDATAAHCWLTVARRCAADSSGFTYQAQAVHRCLAAGLLECPQYTKAESICVTGILDGIATALEAQTAFPPAPTPVFDGRKQHDGLLRALAGSYGLLANSCELSCGLVVGCCLDGPHGPAGS